MFFKKIGITAAILFWVATVFVANSRDSVKVEEIRYRCRVESHNPLWHILFFLFSSDNREFLWREKTGISDCGRLREVELFNKSRRVIRFFNQGENYEAEIVFGGGESGQLNREQAKTWFEMWDFVRSAKAGQIYETPFRTSQNSYAIAIKAKDKRPVEISGGKTASIYFEGKIVKTTNGEAERFLEVRLWVAESGELAGRVIKCFFKKSFWPVVSVEVK